MGMPDTLFIVRHGASEGTLADARSRAGDDTLINLPAHRDRHPSQWHLIAEGRAQAELAGRFLASHDLDRWMVSPYVRTLQTAGLLGLPGARWEVQSLLREQDSGWLATMSQSEREEDWFRRFETQEASAPLLVRPPGGGETAAEVIERARSLFTGHLNDGDRVVLVTHVWVMRALHVLLAGLTQAEYAGWIGRHELPPCSILQYEMAAAPPRWRLIDPTRTPPRPPDWLPLPGRRTYSSQELLDMAGQAAPPVITG